MQSWRRGCWRRSVRGKVLLVILFVFACRHLLVHITGSSDEEDDRLTEYDGKSRQRELPEVADYDRFAPPPDADNVDIRQRERMNISPDRPPAADAKATKQSQVRKMDHEAKKKLSVSQPGECNSYHESVHMARTVKEDVLHLKRSTVRQSSVTLVTQLDSRRLERLVTLAGLWKEAISLAVYVRNGTYLDMMKTLRQALHHRRNIGVHLVHESGSYYPVNFLRNVALKNTFTKYIFTTDIDFMPSPDLHGKLENYLKHGTGFKAERRVLIVPAFEQVNEGAVNIPETKAGILKMWEQRIIKPFHFRYINDVEKETGAQGQTNFEHWKNTASPYTVDWADGFEPYLAFEKEQVQPFNEMFVGRYFNKVTQSLELSVKGFQFIVLPDVYLIHQWHEATPWSDVAYRCSTSTLLALKLQLMSEYGVKLAVKNNMKFSSIFYLPRHPKKR